VCSDSRLIATRIGRKLSLVGAVAQRRRVSRSQNAHRSTPPECPFSARRSAHGRDRLQRIARETTKREAVYADFIMTASKLHLHAYVSDGLRLDSDEHHLIGLANRMRMFAPRTVIDEAEAMIRGIVELSLKPGKDVAKLTVEEVAKNRDSDPLLPFSLASRSDLDNVYRTTL
jgi:hypothetical protein